jgi:hypothetical protein
MIGRKKDTIILFLEEELIEAKDLERDHFSALEIFQRAFRCKSPDEKSGGFPLQSRLVINSQASITFFSHKPAAHYVKGFGQIKTTIATTVFFLLSAIVV